MSVQLQAIKSKFGATHVSFSCSDIVVGLYNQSEKISQFFGSHGFLPRRMGANTIITLILNWTLLFIFHDFYWYFWKLSPFVLEKILFGLLPS